MENFKSFLNNEILRQMLSKYIYIAFWIIVIGFLVNSYVIKSMYKYEPRNIKQSSKSEKNNFKGNNNNRINKEKKESAIIKIVKILMVVAGVGLIVYGFISFISINIKYYVQQIDIYEYLFNILEPLMILELCSIIASGQCDFSSSKRIFNIVSATLLLPISIAMTVHNDLCVDMLVISITLIIVVSFSKTKYYIPIILILLGTHLIVFGNRYLNTTQVDEIMFALGTGLVTTGICNIFTIIETIVKQKNERKCQIDAISREIKRILREMFVLTKKKIKYPSDNWYDLEYDDYKNIILKYLKRRNLTFDLLINNNLLETFEKISSIINSISLNEMYYVTNDVLDIDEVDALKEIGIVFKNILEDYKSKNIKTYKSDFCLFFDKMRYLSNCIPEIKEGLYAMGKNKVNVEWEVGTMRMVWPDGKKVNPREFYKNGNHLND